MSDTINTPTHAPLPVSGYTPQHQTNIDRVNENKILEETVLSRLDALCALPETDKRHLAIARTNIEDAFMWMNRSIFKPLRHGR